MSSSSDIEKLFDHFGGDANAYQEIGRENEARSARTRWPLLVTLDLTQPAIPAIGQPREPKPQAPVSATPLAVDRQDTTPKDVAAVTRAKAPLFARSPRRDIPPVAVAAPQPAAPSGASRFGSLEAEEDSAASASGRIGGPAQGTQSAGSAPVAPVAAGASAPFASVAPVASAASASAPVVDAASSVPAATPAAIPPLATSHRLAPVSAVPPAASMPPASLPPSAPPAFLFRTPAMQTQPPAQAAAPTWAQASAPAPSPAFAPAPATAPAHAYAHAYAPATPTASAQPAQPAQPASILGKLFATDPQAAAPQPAAAASESAPLQSVFDRLRGAPAPTADTTAGVANSWLVNGPRRS